jgi:hypothetical protein
LVLNNNLNIYTVTFNTVKSIRQEPRSLFPVIILLRVKGVCKKAALNFKVSSESYLRAGGDGYRF